MKNKMNKDFKLSKEYEGFWNIPSIGERIPGTLYVKNDSIELTLLSNIPTSLKGDILNAKGSATNNEKTYYFILNDLKMIGQNAYGDNINKYKYDIHNILISENSEIDVDNITNCYIITPLLDKWAHQSFYDDVNCIQNMNNNKIEFIVPSSKLLYDSVSYKLSINCETNYNVGYSIKVQKFLNLYFKTDKNLYESINTADTFIWLFSLLWINYFEPEYIMFNTSSNTEFVYKQSNRYSYKYHNIIDNEHLQTSLMNFDEETFQNIIEKWESLYQNNEMSICTFFETCYNEHLPLSSTIKNYISVIDGLTKHINKKYNTKQRYECIINDINNYVTLDLPTDFVSKSVETRNYLTHMSSNKKDKFNPNDYYKLSVCIKNIITAYIMKNIDISSDIAKHIIEVIKM